MALAGLVPLEERQGLAQELSAIQPFLADYVALFRQLSRQFHVHILSGSFPVQLPNGDYRNRAYLVSPGGETGFQEKMMMTRFEKEEWFLSPSATLHLFETSQGNIGINICYDSEFGVFARRQACQGAQIILVPSCTDTLAGFNRVRIACQARAMENQCYVIQSPLIGNVDWLQAVDVNLGFAGFYGPVDRGFPDDGILAQGRWNEPGWVYADLSLEALETVRREGQVLNHRDWPLADALAANPVERIRLEG